MDLRTGKVYDSIEDAKAAGVSESDLVEIDRRIKTAADMQAAIPTLKFPKSPFGSIKNIVREEVEK